MYTGLTEVADDLFRVDTPLGERVSSLYVIRGTETSALFDTGVDGAIPDHLRPALDRIGVSREAVRHVVISHCDVDHFGGVADARDAFPNARIAAHAEDRPVIEDYATFERERGRSFLDVWGLDEDPAVLDWCRSATREGPLDRDYVDGERIDLGDKEIVVWHVPGHSRGHLDLEAPWAKALVVSDAVLGSSVNLADGSPAFPPTYRHVVEYLASAERIASYAPDLLLTAHYPTMDARAGIAFLDETREFVDRLEAALDKLFGDATHALTLAEAVHLLNAIVGEWPKEGTEGALAFPVVGHLERWVDQGRLARHDRGTEPAAWSLT
jgi:glyoxylase-like metal-dependent hydrolase (beta-lactamase superfamily II)